MLRDKPTARVIRNSPSPTNVFMRMQKLASAPWNRIKNTDRILKVESYLDTTRLTQVHLSVIAKTVMNIYRRRREKKVIEYFRFFPRRSSLSCRGCYASKIRNREKNRATRVYLVISRRTESR